MRSPHAKMSGPTPAPLTADAAKHPTRPTLDPGDQLDSSAGGGLTHHRQTDEKHRSSACQTPCIPLRNLAYEAPTDPDFPAGVQSGTLALISR